MVFSSRIYVGERLILLKVSGNVLLEDAVQGYASIFEAPEYASGLNALWDMRELMICNIGIADIRKLVSFIHKLSARRGPRYKAALVTGHRVDYYLLTSYLVMIRTVGNVHIRVFHQDMVAARYWLKNESW